MTVHHTSSSVTGKRRYPFESDTPVNVQDPQAASNTPADVLVRHGLNPEKARQECGGLRKFLAGQAPATQDFNGMLVWLMRNGGAQGAAKAAALMVAIQKFHPQFVPVLKLANALQANAPFCVFQKEFFRQAATDLGLEVCALWTESSKPFVEELLQHPKCSICTLDFSEMKTHSCWSKSAFTNNSSVKTWQGCPTGWLV